MPSETLIVGFRQREFARYVRVAESADGATSRKAGGVFPVRVGPQRHGRRTVFARPNRVSGIATTASFSAKRATRIAVWPDATTCPASIKVAVTTPRVSASECGVRERIVGEFNRALGPIEACPRLIGRGLGLVELRVGGQPLARKSLARVSAAVACASTPVAARNSASACSA